MTGEMWEKNNSLSFEQQEKLDDFLEEIRDSIGVIPFKPGDSRFSDELYPLIEPFFEENKDIPPQQVIASAIEIKNKFDEMNQEKVA